MKEANRKEFNRRTGISKRNRHCFLAAEVHARGCRVKISSLWNAFIAFWGGGFVAQRPLKLCPWLPTVILDMPTALTPHRKAAMAFSLPLFSCSPTLNSLSFQNEVQNIEVEVGHSSLLSCILGISLIFNEGGKLI